MMNNPDYKYILLNSNTHRFNICEDLEELIDRLNIHVVRGNLYVGDILDTISYNTEEFTEDEMLRNFCRTRLKTFLKSYIPHLQVLKGYETD